MSTAGSLPDLIPYLAAVPQPEYGSPASMPCLEHVSLGDYSLPAPAEAYSPSPVSGCTEPKSGSSVHSSDDDESVVMVTRFEPYECGPDGFVTAIPVYSKEPEEKTECRYYAKGVCRYAISGITNGRQGCRFQHTAQQERVKVWCDYVSRKNCKQPSTCDDVHLEDASRGGPLAKKLGALPRLELHHLSTLTHYLSERIATLSLQQAEALASRIKKMINVAGEPKEALSSASAKILNELHILPFGALRHHTILVLVLLCG